MGKPFWALWIALWASIAYAMGGWSMLLMVTYGVAFGWTGAKLHQYAGGADG